MATAGCVPATEERAELPVTRQIAGTLDAGAENCGRLIQLVAGTMQPVVAGEALRVVAYDPSALVDLPAWCRMLGHRLVRQVDIDGHFEFIIEKGGSNHGACHDQQHTL